MGIGDWGLGIGDERFGLRVANFFVESINFPDEDFEKINSILENKAEFEIMGDGRYVTKRSFDVYQSAAENENGVAGAFAAGGMGIGMGMNMGANINNPAFNPVYQAQAPVNNTPMVNCPSCGALIRAGLKFCNECGQKLVQDQKTCPQCSAVIPASAKFCNECGFAFAEKICKCGAKIEAGKKFCSECGAPVE